MKGGLLPNEDEKCRGCSLSFLRVIVWLCQIDRQIMDGRKKLNYLHRISAPTQKCSTAEK